MLKSKDMILLYHKDWSLSLDTYTHVFDRWFYHEAQNNETSFCYFEGSQHWQLKHCCSLLGGRQYFVLQTLCWQHDNHFFIAHKRDISLFYVSLLLTKAAQNVALRCCICYSMRGSLEAWAVFTEDTKGNAPIMCHFKARKTSCQMTAVCKQHVLGVELQQCVNNTSLE